MGLFPLTARIGETVEESRLVTIVELKSWGNDGCCFELATGEKCRFSLRREAMEAYLAYFYYMSEDYAMDLTDSVIRELKQKEIPLLLKEPDPVPNVEPETSSFYLGKWRAKDDEGKSLGKLFNVYAGSRDLRKSKFNDAIVAVAHLQNWEGHNGILIKNDTELNEKIGGDSYCGEWFVPTQQMLQMIYNKKQSMKIYEDGAYWSCTHRIMQTPEGPTMAFWNLRFRDGKPGWNNGSICEFSTRPVRLEPV